MTRDVEAVVVDDSQFMRRLISDLLTDADIDVVATAADGAEAAERVADHRPDVVTMDVEMPGVDGLAAVERIMAETPTPIVMLSAHTEEGSEVTFEALERGAVDFFTKPGGELSTDVSRHADRLVQMIVSAAASTPQAADGATDRRPATDDRFGERTYQDRPTLVIGASTGGPKVVERVLADLPLAADFRVFVVQHMPDGFTERFAERLDRASDYDVAEATNGARVGGGEALVAKGGHHMEVSRSANGRHRVRLTDGSPRHGVRPAVDVTMETVASTIDGPLIGAVFTGMGRDGAAGLTAIARANGRTVAQDEATSVVYGMPKAAVATGCVDVTCPADELSAAIVDGVSR